MSKTNKYFLPAEDVNDEKAKIVKLFFDSGDKVTQGDLIYSFETTKAIVDVETEFDGYIEYFAAEGEEINIGSLVCKISKTRKEISDKTKNRVVEKQKKVRPTKKALIIAEKYNIEIEKLGLEGIVKEKDLIPYVSEEKQAINVERCLFINKEDKFINYLIVDESFRNLSSEDKIKKYKKNGHNIGDNVKIQNGAVLIGNKIKIEDNVSIGNDT